MTEPQQRYDAIILGGGPAGATAALVLARAGINVALLEKHEFPRFHIGESFLPANFALLERLGVLDAVRRAPHMRKFGAEFAMGDTPGVSSLYDFSTGLVGGMNETINIARSDFDAVMLNAARDAGATIHMPAAAKSIGRLEDGDVSVLTNGGARLDAAVLLDATGQATVVGRRFGIRRLVDAPHLRKIACFQHFEGVKRLPDRQAGYPTVVMCDEGWFWLIPLNERITSVGLVIERDVAKRAGIPPERLLAWGIERCPFVRERMRKATGPETNLICADYSYSCRPYSGPGYFLLGDAATFFDPVFSTGVCHAMMSAIEAAEQVISMLKHGASPAHARQRYNRFFERGSRIFQRVIHHYYDHAFRELFLHGRGPLDIHRGVLTVLAGHIYPQPPVAARWRMSLFEGLIHVQRRVAIVPRRARFSLFESGVVGGASEFESRASDDLHEPAPDPAAAACARETEGSGVCA